MWNPWRESGSGKSYLEQRLFLMEGQLPPQKQLDSRIHFPQFGLIFFGGQKEESGNALPCPLALPSHPCPQTRSSNTDGGDTVCVSKPWSCLLCGHEGPDMCTSVWLFSFGGKYEVFPKLLVDLHFRAQQEMFNWQVLSEVTVCHIFFMESFNCSAEECVSLTGKWKRDCRVIPWGMLN